MIILLDNQLFVIRFFTMN